MMFKFWWLDFWENHMVGGTRRERENKKRDDKGSSSRCLVSRFICNASCTDKVHQPQDDTNEARDAIQWNVYVLREPRLGASRSFDD